MLGVHRILFKAKRHLSLDITSLSVCLLSKTIPLNSPRVQDHRADLIGLCKTTFMFLSCETEKKILGTHKCVQQGNPRSLETTVSASCSGRKFKCLLSNKQ